MSRTSSPLHLLSAATLSAAFALSAGLASPPRAEACGGTFCDGPQGMAVDQSGENILFVIDGDQVEAHIQIQYDPQQDPASFAWVIPLQSLPQFSVGSQPLFDQLLAGTVPFYGITDQAEFCGGGDLPGGSNGDDDDDDGGAPKFDAGGGGPSIVHAETVGAFEVTVLQDDDVDSLMQWLGDNGYQQDDAAAPIFAEYLAEGHLFAAFKLNTGAGLDQIHPVTLSFQGVEPCIPLRLTKIAATEDMEVRAFFLGNTRTAPTNYRHVLVNPLKIDWFNFADNYKAVITAAVDAFEANGHAFVTEYAGPSDAVQRSGLYEPSWSSEAFVGSAPLDAVSTLESQGIMACFGEFCEFYHPLLEPLLAEFLPAPEGVDPLAFYACVECYEAQLDLMAWGDGGEFAAAYDDRIIAPGMHALDLLETWPYVTRLYTTISPGEMTEDPMFAQNPDLPEVASQRVATRVTLCNDDRVVVLPDGREVYVPGGEDWPEFPGEMPWEAEVQTVALKGAPMTLVDNNEIIDQKLAEWNIAHGWPPGDGSTPSSGSVGDDDGGSGDETGPNADSSGDGSGCGCTSDARGAPWALALLLLGGAVWSRRRQR